MGDFDMALYCGVQLDTPLSYGIDCFPHLQDISVMMGMFFLGPQEDDNDT